MATDQETTIRAAGADDAALLADFGARVFMEAFGAMNNPDDMAAYVEAEFSPARAAAELSAPGSRFLIAEIEGVAAGYARLTVDGEAPSCVTLARPLEINRFYIDQPWHGRGVAHALMTACLEQAKAHDCDGLWLGVWKHNPRALAFYRKWNFAIVGEQPFQLGRDPQMDLVMQRANRLDE